VIVIYEFYEEIGKNYFNLNISRYISTAVSEEIIDLKKINANLIDIEKKAREAADKHNQYLKELGLTSI
jgi:type I restriction enzyme M protein